MKTKQMAIYKHLKPVYEDVNSLKHSHALTKEIIDHLYLTGSQKTKDFIDKQFAEDDTEMNIDNIQESLVEYETVLEKKYNEWKFDHYGQELFTKLDSSLFDVTFIEID